MVRTRTEGNVIYVEWDNAWRTLGIGLCILFLMLAGVHLGGAYGNPFTKAELQEEVRNRLLAGGKYTEKDIVRMSCQYSSSGSYTVYVTFANDTIRSYDYVPGKNETAFVLARETEMDKREERITIDDLGVHQD